MDTPAPQPPIDMSPKPYDGKRNHERVTTVSMDAFKMTISTKDTFDEAGTRAPCPPLSIKAPCDCEDNKLDWPAFMQALQRLGVEIISRLDEMRTNKSAGAPDGI